MTEMNLSMKQPNQGHRKKNDGYQEDWGEGGRRME